MIQETDFIAENLINLITFTYPPKAYWSVLKMVLKNKKNSIIPPLFYQNRFYKKGWIT